MEKKRLSKSVSALFMLFLILSFIYGRYAYEVKAHNHVCTASHCDFCAFYENTRNSSRSFTYILLLAVYFLFDSTKRFFKAAFSPETGEKEETLVKLKVRLNN